MIRKTLFLKKNNRRLTFWRRLLLEETSVDGLDIPRRICVSRAILELGLMEELRMPLGASRIAAQVVAEAGRIEKANWAADAFEHVCGHGPERPSCVD